MTIKSVPQIGEPVLRIDGWDKATGAQIYPSDLILDDMLILRVFRSPHPHARILSLDTSAAEQAPGVVSVVTAADIPGEKNTGLFIKDTPVLCAEIVRRHGDPIAIVAAETEEAARHACTLIEVEYELLPVISDSRVALQPDSPLVHPDGNLVAEKHMAQGNVDKAFANADLLIFEHEYYTGRQEHAFLEPEGGAAYYDEEGRLTVRFGGQHPHWDQQIIADVLGVECEEVRVISPMVGGSFGGKDDIDVQLYLALVTHLTQRPCRIRFDRDESIIAGTKRHPYVLSYKTACTADGEWVAAEVTLVADTGAYASWAGEVLDTAIHTCLGFYKIPNVKIDAYCAYTNNSNGGAFRGFGALQAVFGLEQHVDIMARACNLDPIEFRYKNAPEPGDLTALGFVQTQPDSFKQSLDAAVEGPLYSRRDELTRLPAAESYWKRRGVGIASTWMGIGYGAGVDDHAEVHIALNSDGYYDFLLGGTDMGQGNATALMQMAAHELNCQMEDFVLTLGDSLGPDAGSCDAARQMTLVGSATVKAARHLREQILDEAARELQTTSDALALQGKSVVVKATGQERSLAGLGEMTGMGAWEKPNIEALIPGFPANSYTTSTQVALVEVDLLTGKVDVLKLHSVIDAGKVINRQGIEGQSEGGLVQALGYALLEDTLVVGGQIINPNFSTYIIPTISDVPYEIITTTLEEPGIGPYGAKGIAEVVLIPTAAAILNAVYDAVGVRYTKIPLTAEEVLWGLSDEN